MDRELWKLIYRSVQRAARIVGQVGRRPRYTNGKIVAMYIWSVWHDRPLCWACERSHYNTLFRPRGLPSVSQFTRRIKSDACLQILQLVHDDLAGRGVVCAAGYIAGKPLLVSPVSKDREAKSGKISGGYGKGYKLHAFVNQRRRIVVWSVMSLNFAEQTVAAELLAYLPPLLPEALVMMDSNYDSAPLHKHSDQFNVHLINPLKGQKRVGPDGHHPVTLRQMGATRRSLVRIWDDHPDLMRYVMQMRDEIERVLGVLTCTAGGLAGLPSWVRTLSRVRRWVGVKIILYNARLTVQEKLAATEEASPQTVAA